MKGRCGHNESELQVSWVDGAYTLKLLFVKVTNQGVRREGVQTPGEHGQWSPLC